jgi:hypothetical protein
VGQQIKLLIEEFFIDINLKNPIHLNRIFLLNFESNHWSFCVVY